MRWALLLAIAAASAGGVAIRAAGYPAAIPQAVTWALTDFIEPGLTIWWFTSGGVFQSFPFNASGYVVTVVANAVFWILVATFVISLARLVRQRVGAG